MAFDSILAAAIHTLVALLGGGEEGVLSAGFC
jgi:hypothetical protein